MRDIEDYTEKYMKSYFEEILVKYRRRLILEQIEQYKPTRILDIGCGYDPLFQYVHEAGFTCIEPSRVFYEHGLELSRERGNVHLIHGFFEQIVDTLEKDYDMVICSGLLQEVEKPDVLLQSIFKMCSKDTVVHINVSNANSMHRLLALESGYIKDVHDMSARNRELQQHSVFDMKSLTEFVEKEGFKVMDSGSYFIKPFTHTQMEKGLNEGIITEEILDGLYGMEKYMPGLGCEIYVNCIIQSKLDS